MKNLNNEATELLNHYKYLYFCNENHNKVDFFENLLSNELDEKVKRNESDMKKIEIMLGCKYRIYKSSILEYIKAA